LYLQTFSEPYFRSSEINELTTTNNEEAEAVVVELELFIQHQIEQEAIDRNDLQMFEQIKEQKKLEEINAKRARRFYIRLVKKYVNSLLSS
jgi:hypothetical protein